MRSTDRVRLSWFLTVNECEKVEAALEAVKAGVAGLSDVAHFLNIEGFPNLSQAANLLAFQYDRLRLLSEQDRPSFTYFLKSGDLVKIGRSLDPISRFNQYRTHNPNGLVFLAIVPEDRLSESDAHAMFAHLRRQGGWFEASPDLLEFAAALTAAAIRTGT
jgi:hypothetical protein